MPKYYCDYCDVYLTHDSASVRKAHNSGKNHVTNVRDWYASLWTNEAQDRIDKITRQYGGQQQNERPHLSGPPPHPNAFPPGPPLPPGAPLPPPGAGPIRNNNPMMRNQGFPGGPGGPPPHFQRNPYPPGGRPGPYNRHLNNNHGPPPHHHHNHHNQHHHHQQHGRPPFPPNQPHFSNRGPPPPHRGGPPQQPQPYKRS